MFDAFLTLRKSSLNVIEYNMLLSLPSHPSFSPPPLIVTNNLLVVAMITTIIVIVIVTITTTIIMTIVTVTTTLSSTSFLLPPKSPRPLWHYHLEDYISFLVFRLKHVIDNLLYINNIACCIVTQNKVTFEGIRSFSKGLNLLTKTLKVIL